MQINVASSTLRVRKAASLALAVPGVSFVVYQHDWPPLLVARSNRDAPAPEVWIHITPAQFSDELGRRPVDHSAMLGPTLGVAETDVSIEVFVDGPTLLDAAGLFTVQFRNRSAVGFVASMDTPLPRSAPFGVVHDDQPEVWPHAFVADVFAEMGTQVLSWVYPTDDLRAAQIARNDAFETLLAMSVDEVSLFAAAQAA